MPALMGSILLRSDASAEEHLKPNIWFELQRNPILSQFRYHPTLNEEDDVVTVLNIRVRMTFSLGSTLPFERCTLFQ